MTKTLFSIRRAPAFTSQNAKDIVKLIELLLIATSVLVFSTGYLSYDMHTSFIGVFLLFLGNILFGFLKLRARLLFLFLHGGIFLFLLTRPLIGSMESDETWMLSSLETTMFALGSIYLSMMCLLLGAVVYEGIVHYNEQRSVYRKDHQVKKPQHSYRQKTQTSIPVLSEIAQRKKQKAIRYIRFTTLVLFLICLAGSFYDGANMLAHMQGHAYEDYYLMDLSQPWIIGVLTPMMPFMLCAYLATMPRRKPTAICLILYVASTIPMLMIGSRSGLVLAFLFAALYYTFRALTDKTERWINKRMLAAVAIAAPLGIFAMGMINYTRAGSVVDMGFFALISDALFKQGVSFTVLGHGYDVNPQIQDLGFRFFVMGSFISNITDGFIGQTFLGCPDLGDTNSVLLALNGHSYAHTMSYFAHPNYLGGEGYGSSYILELFADFGWAGIIVGSFLLGIVLCMFSRMIGRGWFAGTVALISAMSVFHMPRGYAAEWISFIWTTRFLLAMTLIVVGSALLAYISHVGAQHGMGLWSKATRQVAVAQQAQLRVAHSTQETCVQDKEISDNEHNNAGVKTIPNHQERRYNKYKIPVIS